MTKKPSVRVRHQSSTLPPVPPTWVCRHHAHGSLSLAWATGTKARSLWPWEEGEEKKMRLEAAMDSGRERMEHHISATSWELHSLSRVRQRCGMLTGAAVLPTKIGCEQNLIRPGTEVWRSGGKEVLLAF